MTEQELKDYIPLKMEVKQLERLRASLIAEREADIKRGWLSPEPGSGFQFLIDRYAGKIQEHREQILQIEATIDAMPEPCRQICRLHYIEGKTLEAITWEIHYSLQSVNRYKKKALAYL